MWDYNEPRPISLAWYLIAAALFHVVMWQATQKGFITLPSAPVAEQNPAPIEVEKFDQTASDGRLPVVQTDRARFDKKLLKEKKARFAGEFDNRVDQETRAAMSGKFQAGPSQLEQKRRLEQAMDRSRDRSVDSRNPVADDGDIPSEQMKRPAPTPGTPGALGMSDLMAFGASPNKFPTDIPAGPNT